MRRIATRLLLAVALIGPGAVIGALPAAAQDAAGSSAVTLSGAGEFANLKVTVDQTRNLINRTVRITWAGGTATAAGAPGNFLQIMQCWGDDPAGPDPMQCQFGATANADRDTGTRHLPADRLDPRLLVDPRQQVPVDANFSFLPFWPAGKARPTTYTDLANPFFDQQLTNEVPQAKTRPDGTGQIDFEVQTIQESAGLGCGEPDPKTNTGRPCWLVVVPRGGSPLGISPLSQDARPEAGPHLDPWKDRIQFPLGFLPVGKPCPLGAPERLLAGHEVAVDAISSWQPALCANGGALYGYTQLPDNLARNQLSQGTDPGLAIVTNPVPPDQQPPDRPLVYAPVAASALTFAFNIVSNPNAPNFPSAGLPFTSMKLTPRLVAKLLTQSYRNSLAGLGGGVTDADAALAATPAHPPRLQSNPISLTTDKEFLALNPEYEAGFAPPVRTLVQLAPSDLTGQLWSWVLADPDARAFVNGTPDPSGMVVNDAEKNLALPLETYPRNDDSCIVQRIGTTLIKPFCSSDEHLYAADMHDAARSASRGDSLGLDNGNFNTDPSKPPLGFQKKPRQLVENRALISIVDVATAARYRLPTAALLSADGRFVAPDAAGLQAGLDAMKPGPTVPSVLQADPTGKNPAAYPLTTVSYAATSPQTLVGADGKKAARELAAFLRYAAGPGQVQGTLPGQLPIGYLPLPEKLRAQTLATATDIETNAGKAAGGVPGPAGQPGSNATGSGSSGNNAGGGSGPAGAGPAGGDVTTTGASGNAAGAAPPGAGTPAAAVGPGAVTALGTPKTVAATQPTPPLPAPAVGALLVALLIGGGLAAALAPVTHLLSNQPRTPGGDAADRTATRPLTAWLTTRPTFLTSRR